MNYPKTKAHLGALFFGAGKGVGRLLRFLPRRHITPLPIESLVQSPAYFLSTMFLSKVATDFLLKMCIEIIFDARHVLTYLVEK